MTPSILELEKLLEQAAAASRGPWTVEKAETFSGRNWLVCSFGMDGESGLNVWATTDGLRASDCNGATALDDAAFVAAAKEAIPRLVQEVIRLRGLVGGGA